MTSRMKRVQKVSGKPGKRVYIALCEFDLVQVKFLWAQITVKYENDP